MTLAQLQYLVALDTHRHFGEAAAACGVTQPTLSTQVKRLEDELGLELVDRSRQPVVSTGAGERIVKQARAVLAARDQLVTLAGDVQDRITGTLRLGLLPTLAPYLLPLVVPAMDTAYPEVTLVVREWPTAELLDALRTDTLDAVLLSTDDAGPDFHERSLFTEPFVGYVAPSHPLSEREHLRPVDLSLNDLWLLSEGHCFRDQVLQVCGVAPSTPQTGVQFESGSLETLVHLVRHTGGMTLLPALATCHMRADDRATHVRPFEAPPPSRHVRLVRRRPHKQRLLDAFADTLAAALPDVVSPANGPDQPSADGDTSGGSEDRSVSATS
ncbi:MAG: hydrogen peroxide-inducible genes activator [Salinibacter sp.]